jgi:hypothetical protein
MTTLLFAHFDHFIPCNPSQGVNDLDKMLCVCLIILHTKFFHY